VHYKYLIQHRCHTAQQIRQQSVWVFVSQSAQLQNCSHRRSRRFFLHLFLYIKINNVLFWASSVSMYSSKQQDRALLLCLLPLSHQTRPPSWANRIAENHTAPHRKGVPKHTHVPTNTARLYLPIDHILINFRFNWIQGYLKSHNLLK